MSQYIKIIMCLHPKYFLPILALINLQPFFFFLHFLSQLNILGEWPVFAISALYVPLTPKISLPLFLTDSQ